MLECLACEGSDCLSPRAKCVGASVCYEVVSFSNGLTDSRKGCLDETYAKLQCYNKTTKSSKLVTRCCRTDFCNDQIDLSRMSSDAPSPNYPIKTVLIPTIVILIVVFVLLVAIALYFFKKKTKNTEIINDTEKGRVDEDDLISETSGSGLGLPLLVPRTLSKDIQLFGKFYCGKSTEVWKGAWKGVPVAVKVFYTRDENLFNNELNVYKSINKHQNILELLASDCTSIDCCTQQWLVTSYCDLGSLYDYLSTTTIDQDQCLSFLFGIINGLDYLHSEDKSLQIAHRDLKSKNILVKNHLDVCIADFGLSVRYICESKKIINGSKYKVGTIRYMAPEILSDRFDGTKFESHKKSDIYSLSLVMWEIIRRCCDSNGQSDEYSLPFGGVVPSDPTYEDMTKVVCLDDQRPLINGRMSSDPVLARIVKLIEECWNAQPSKRLTSLRLKKSLIKISSERPLP